MLALMLPRKTINKPKIQSSTKTKTPVKNSDEVTPTPKPKPLAMRLFSREKKSKTSSSKHSSLNNTDTQAPPRSTLQHPYTSLESPPLSPPPRIDAITTQPNPSTSNLSTTSTLLDLPSSSHRAAPQSPIRQSSDSYEAFLSRAQEQEVREREMAYAWMRAEERRKASMSWPSDPWRGGFGPPSSGVVFGRRDGGVRALNPRRVAHDGEEGVRGWLGRNGLVGR